MLKFYSSLPKQTHFDSGVSIPLYRNKDYSKLCPYLALRAYFSKHIIEFVAYQSSTDPLRALSSNVFIHLKHILSRIGLNNMLYSGHSFRIGAASSGPGCSFTLSGHLRLLVRVGY